MVAADAALARDAARARQRVSGPGDEPDRGGSTCASGCSLLVGLAALCVCVALFRVGEAEQWTSDGPGMLLVMLGVGASGLVAFAGLVGALVERVPGLRRLFDALE